MHLLYIPPAGRHVLQGSVVPGGPDEGGQAALGEGRGGAAGGCLVTEPPCPGAHAGGGLPGGRGACADAGHIRTQVNLLEITW